MKFSLPKVSMGLALAILAGCFIALHQSGLRIRSWQLDDWFLGILLTVFFCIPLFILTTKLSRRK